MQPVLQLLIEHFSFVILLSNANDNLFSIDDNSTVGNECQACQKGEKQPLAGQETCEPCDADKGEYQTEVGSSYCKTTHPGYQLNAGSTTGTLLTCSLF